jgi:hypothetical protein
MSFTKYLKLESLSSEHDQLVRKIRAGVRSKISLEEMAKVLKLSLDEDGIAMILPGWLIDNELIDRAKDAEGAARIYGLEQLDDLDSISVEVYQKTMDEDGDESKTNETSFHVEMDSRGKIKVTEYH